VPHLENAVKYPSPTINSLPQGCITDFRVAIAIELLKSGAVPLAHDPNALNPAVRALDLAEDLMVEAELRGLVQPLPIDSELPAHEIAHVQRNAGAQVVAQMHQQRVATEIQRNQIVPVRGGLNG
jgi:hypothetical protein